MIAQRPQYLLLSIFSIVVILVEDEVPHCGFLKNNNFIYFCFLPVLDLFHCKSCSEWEGVGTHCGIWVFTAVAAFVADHTLERSGSIVVTGA